MNTPQSIRHYSNIADKYDDIVATAGYTLPERVFNICASFMDLSGLSVLDLGIGTGLSSYRFKLAGNRVVGIDGSLEMLRFCQEQLRADDVIHHDLSDGSLCYLSGSFDIVVCLGLIEFIRYPKRLIDAVAARINVGGIVVLALRDRKLNPGFTSMYCEGFDIDERAFKEHGIVAFHHALTEIQNIFSDAGLRIRCVEDVFAYRSPTQGAETFNRLIVGEKTAP